MTVTVHRVAATDSTAVVGAASTPVADSAPAPTGARPAAADTTGAPPVTTGTPPAAVHTPPVAGDRPAAAGSAPAAASRSTDTDPLLGMLFPFWQLAIGVCVVAVTIAALYRVARRGRSRMGTALLVTGGAIVALAVVGSLLGGH